MHQAKSSSSLFYLWTGRSLPAALHPASRRRSYLPLRTDQCFCPIGTFTLLLVRTLRRTPIEASPRSLSASRSWNPTWISHSRFSRTTGQVFRRQRSSARLWEQLREYFEVRFRAEKYGVPYFLAESEAKQSDPRKEAAGARARNAVED
jgi:hypothetical protein